jgi:hypothetical protein
VINSGKPATAVLLLRRLRRRVYFRVLAKKDNPQKSN